MADFEFSKGADRGRPRGPQEQPEPAEGLLHPAFRYGVVVGFDGSTSSERALAYAIGVSARRGSGLIIVHVATRLPGTGWGDEEFPLALTYNHGAGTLIPRLAASDSLAGVAWLFLERRGDVCGELEKVGREYSADAIVVGSPRSIVGRRVRSVASRLARRAHHPVLVIP